MNFPNTQNNYLRGQPDLLYLPRRTSASEDRLSGIHNYNVKRFFVYDRQKINFCGRFPHNSPGFLIAKDCSNAASNELALVCHKNPDFFHLLPRWTCHA